MSFNNISILCESDISIVNQHIQQAMRSEIPLVEEISSYIIQSGGKRLRPLLSILIAKACRYSGDKHTLLAAVIECLHTATLLHDDVIDNADQRRGQPTANEHWGNAKTILVGDFIYSRAFQMIVAIRDHEVSATIAKTASQIAEGEVQQLINAGNPNLPESAYLETIERKTAVLFAAAAKSAAILAQQEASTQANMHAFGKYLGVMFQILDDILDYDGDPKTTGKNVGTDLSEGKMTLPLIYTLQHAQPEHKVIIKQAVSTQNIENSDIIINLVNNSGAIDYARLKAHEYANKAKQSLDCLPTSEFKQALIELVDISLTRNH